MRAGALHQEAAMKILAIAIIAFFACTAATCEQRPTSGVDAHCAQQCFDPCKPLEGWDGNREEKHLSALMDLHDDQQKACDGQRAACVVCIETARAAGAIK
jgi:hypothetical protein